MFSLCLSTIHFFPQKIHPRIKNSDITHWGGRAYPRQPSAWRTFNFKTAAANSLMLPTLALFATIGWPLSLALPALAPCVADGRPPPLTPPALAPFAANGRPTPLALPALAPFATNGGPVPLALPAPAPLAANGRPLSTDTMPRADDREYTYIYTGYRLCCRPLIFDVWMLGWLDASVFVGFQ